MNKHPQGDAELFAGLHVLVEATFPKRCRTCGREYADAAEFLSATQQVRPDSSGLRQSLDDDGQPIVDVFRNCVCGSTLLESFYDRRDLSARGIERRRHFEDFLIRLVAAGIEAEVAHDELRKLVRGLPNEVAAIIQALRSR